MGALLSDKLPCCLSDLGFTELAYLHIHWLGVHHHYVAQWGKKVKDYGLRGRKETRIEQIDR
jgi:hypothetical protein